MQESKRELNGRRVRRATQALVAASVAATAIFVGAAARGTGSAGDETDAGSAGDVASSFQSADDDMFAPSSSAPTDSIAVPSAVSGGS
ncbi:MAG TPA: hypothetical protein VK278_03580 [Gaiellaceae bacterium]|nr:hypothetical protein [Gaiellaceae bacterium]